MRTLLSLVCLAVIGLNLCLPMQAQTKDFRDPGFKGSVSLSFQKTDRVCYGPGIAVSLGKMFNRNHYVGGEFEVLSDLIYFQGIKNPDGSWVEPVFFWNSLKPRFWNYRLSADYRFYVSEKRSTPVAGVRIGMDFHDLKSFRGFYLQPSVGWSWTLPSGNGFMVSAGVDLYHDVRHYLGGPGPAWIQFFPKLSVTYEF